MKRLVISIILIVCFVAVGSVGLAAENDFIAAENDFISEENASEASIDAETDALEHGSPEYLRKYGFAPSNLKGHTVQFFVYYDNDKPVEGASVNINSESRAITNANGAASVNLEDGTYSYEIAKTSFETVSGSFTVKGEDITLPQINMMMLSKLSFVVTDGNIGIEGAQVKVDGQKLATNVSGEVQFWVKNGTYEYTVERRGLKAVSGSVVVSENITQAVEMADSCRVEFSVTDDSGQPVAGAEVAVAGAPNVVTDANGKAYTWLEVGSHTYTTTHSQNKTSQGSFSVDGKITIVNIDMLRNRYTALFTVKDVNGAVVEGVKISIPDAELYTNVSGEALGKDLLSGNYEISAGKAGYKTYAGEFSVKGKPAKVTIVLALAEPVPTPSPSVSPTPSVVPVPTAEPQPDPTQTAKPVPTQRPTSKPSGKPTTTPQNTVSAKPTVLPSASSTPKKTPVIASPMPTATPTASAQASQTDKPIVAVVEPAEESQPPSSPPAQGLISLGFNFVDANGDPLVDYITELHSDVMSGRTDSDGYIFYIDVPKGAHTLYLKNPDGSVLAKKDFTLEDGTSTSHELTELGADKFNVKNAIEAVTVDVIYDDNQLVLANVHEGWSQFYSELPNSADKNKLNSDLVFWLIIGIAILVLVLVVLIVLRKNNVRGAVKKNNYLHGDTR